MSGSPRDGWEKSVQEELSHTGNSDVDMFKVSAEELERRAGEIEERVENLGKQRSGEGWMLRDSPRPEEVRQDSERLGDENAYHRSARIVEEFLSGSERFQNYPGERAPALVSQGRRLAGNAIASTEEPLKSSDLRYENMVLACEGQSDSMLQVPVVDGPTDLRTWKLPGGDPSEAGIAADMEAEFFSGEAHPDHNLYHSAVGDYLVSRGEETDSLVRNGDLLLGTSLEWEGESPDWESVEQVRFERDYGEEEPVKTVGYDVSVEAGDETFRGYAEEVYISPDEFEKAVRSASRNGPLAVYMEELEKASKNFMNGRPMAGAARAAVAPARASLFLARNN